MDSDEPRSRNGHNGSPADDPEIRELEVLVLSKFLNGGGATCPVVKVDLFERDDGFYLAESVENFRVPGEAVLSSRPPAFLVAELAPVQTVGGEAKLGWEPWVSSSAQTIAFGLQMLFAGCDATPVDHRHFDTALGLSKYMEASSGLYTHMVLVGHGSVEGLSLLDEEGIGGSRLGELLGQPNASGGLQVVSTCCFSGCDDFARQLSLSPGIQSVVGPESTWEVWWSTIFVQSYLLHYWDTTDDELVAIQNAAAGNKLPSVALWRDGEKAGSSESSAPPL